MRSISPRYLARFALLLALTGFFAACDRHPAGELGKSYGHGSSHEKSYRNHTTDSTKDTSHFSDTLGMDAGKPAGAEAASPQPAAPVPREAH